MAESAKDLSTTSFGLIAAYVLPGAIALAVVGWCQPGIGKFLLEDAEHFTLAVAVALMIGVLLNGLRLALLSRWLFKEMSYSESDFESIEPGQFSELQAAIDEVFRLHQFYSALYFLFPIGLIWLIVHAFDAGVGRIDWGKSILAAVLLATAWRALARAVLETYEFYHQIAMGVLRRPLPKGPPDNKARLIAVLFSAGYSDRAKCVTTVPPFGRVGNTIVLVGRRFTVATTVSFAGTPAEAPIVESDSYLRVIVPNAARTGPVILTEGNSTLTCNKKFRVTPQVTAFNPPDGPVGAVVTINGVSLTQMTNVTFGGVQAITKNVLSDTQVTAVVPQRATTGRIVITTLGGSASSAGEFRVT